MASALRRFPGGSTFLIIYAPYDVFLIIILPLFPPPVIVRLWLSFYNDPPVIVLIFIIYVLVAIFCGVSPIII